MKEITFYIENIAYTINIGEDPSGELEEAIRGMLDTDKNLTTKDLLLAYLRRSQEFVQLQDKIKAVTLTIPSLEQFREHQQPTLRSTLSVKEQD